MFMAIRGAKAPRFFCCFENLRFFLAQNHVLSGGKPVLDGQLGGLCAIEMIDL